MIANFVAENKPEESERIFFKYLIKKKMSIHKPIPSRSILLKLKKKKYIFRKIICHQQKTQVQSVDQEDPLKKEITTKSSILPWEILWTEKLGGLQSMGSQKHWTQFND